MARRSTRSRRPRVTALFRWAHDPRFVPLWRAERVWDSPRLRWAVNHVLRGNPSMRGRYRVFFQYHRHRVENLLERFVHILPQKEWDAILEVYDNITPLQLCRMRLAVYAFETRDVELRNVLRKEWNNEGVLHALVNMWLSPR